jgi:hypothetical protein
MTSLLKRMDEGRIFDIQKEKDGTFTVGELCDSFFCETLTVNELRELGQEIINLANGDAR